MDRKSVVNTRLFTASSRSRRTMLKSIGIGAALVGAGGLLRTTSAQSSQSSSEIDALYDSGAAMPHLFAEIAFPFVRRNWEMNGRGTIIYSLDTAVAAGAVTQEDATLIGEPDTLYSASMIKPEGESWSTARYLTIFNYASPEDAAAAAGRFVAAGVPAGGADLTSNLDPALGEAISYAITTDLEGTPAEQVFSIFAAGNWLFRYYSLTPQLASASLSRSIGLQAAPPIVDVSGLSTGVHPLLPQPGTTMKARSISAIPLAIGEDVANEAAAMVAAALTFNSTEFLRNYLRDKGFSDEDINDFVAGVFPKCFGASTATRIDYPKHNNRDFNQFTGIDADNEMQSAYYSEAMCVVADDAPIPPGNANYYYDVKRFFMTADDAAAFFNSQPTPAQQASHAANGVTFEDDADASTADTKTSYISWQPAGATSTFPGYGFSRLRGPVVSSLNVYNVDPPSDGPKSVDPANSLYQSLRTGVLDILNQQQQFESNLSGWPVYETPETFAG